MKTSVAWALLALVVVGCPPSANVTEKPKVVSKPALAIANLPVSMNVKQRSTTVVPGTADELSLTADDITRGQVMASLVQKGGAIVLGQRSMKFGDTVPFRFGKNDYSLSLTTLTNSLVGEDFATFTITKPGQTPVQATSTVLTETQKIDRLIQAVESMKNCVFIRNGAEYTPKEAAEHLRRKLDTAGGKVATAEQFIDAVASKSSISGEEYTIRFADGRTISAGEYLRDELAKLKPGRTAGKHD